jgi:cold shock CspA family protein
MAIGVCTFWRDDKGYGLFAINDGSDLFVHASQVRLAGYTALTQGQCAQFDIGSNAKTGQPIAIDLVLLEPIVSPKATLTAF